MAENILNLDYKYTIIEKILDSSVYCSTTSYSLNIPQDGKLNYIILSKDYRGNSTAAQLDHTITVDNGTIENLYSLSSTSGSVNLWLYTKENDIDGTLTFSIGRSDTTLFIQAFSVPFVPIQSTVSVSGVTDSSNNTTVTIVDNSLGSVYYMLTYVNRGNSSLGQMIHMLRTDNGVFEHYLTIGHSDSYCFNVWIYRKAINSSSETLQVTAGRNDANFGAISLQLL